MIYKKQQPEQTNVFVFRTNLQHAYDVKKVEGALNKLKSILKWSVDLMDWEKVLRIEAVNTLAKKAIVQTLRQKGYLCHELNH